MCVPKDFSLLIAVMVVKPRYHSIVSTVPITKYGSTLYIGMTMV